MTHLLRRLPYLAACWVAMTAGCILDGEEDSESLDESAGVAKVALDRTWVLKGDGLTEGAASLHVEIGLPASYKYARVAIDAVGGKTITRGSDGKFAADVPVADLAPGTHKVIVASKSSKKALGTATFNVSFPLYVVVSTDWDDTRMSDDYLHRMEMLRDHHPALKVTQFFAPFHYTDPKITPARKQQIEDFVKTQRDQYGDEIGMHIHAWCHFIDTTGVPCRTQETFYKNDGSGYTTILAAYTEEEMTTILQAGRAIFAEHDLGAPSAFRAGGWTADVKVMRALVATGFTVESSAVANPEKWLIDWKGFDLYSWTTEHWKGITETSQPYFPLEANVATPDPDRGLPLLEVPDNGVLVDYVTGEDMTMIYDLNHDGGVLEEPTLYQVGFHPPDFSTDFLNRMDTALSHVDEHAYEADKGPAVYVNISDLARVWK